MGTTDQAGATSWHPEHKVVVAINEGEARQFFQKSWDDLAATMRKQMAGRPTPEVEAMITKVTAKTDLTVEEFGIAAGLVI